MTVSNLLILGVDAADFSVLDDSDVSLPTFERLIADGVTGPLRSSDPPITGAAWPSMACGRDPNSIGMFDFTNFSSEDTREYRPRPDRVDAFWSYLSEHGYSVGVSGYPLAPLDKSIDGFVLSWPWYLPDDEPYLAPSEFFDDSDITVSEYIRPSTELTPEVIVRDLEDKIAFDERVLSTYDFDVYCTYLDADSIIHTTDVTAENRDPLYNVYRTIDDGIDSLLSLAGEDCTVLVVSDHGISDVCGQVHLNQPLVDEGFLSIAQSVGEQVASNSLGRQLYGVAKSVVKRAGLAPYVRSLLLSDSDTRRQSGLPHPLAFDRVEWDSSVFVHTGDWGQIYGVGQTDRDDRTRLVATLREVADDTGLDVQIQYPEDVYVDEPHPDAPEVIVTFHRNDRIVVPTETVVPDASTPADYFEMKDVDSVHHGQSGVFIAAGPDIRSGDRLPPLDIVDVSPFVLNHVLGTVPPRVHGKPPDDIYRAGASRNSDPVTGLKTLQDRLIDDSPMTQAEAQDVREKLGDLGYFQ